MTVTEILARIPETRAAIYVGKDYTINDLRDDLAAVAAAGVDRGEPVQLMATAKDAHAVVLRKNEWGRWSSDRTVQLIGFMFDG